MKLVVPILSIGLVAAQDVAMPEDTSMAMPEDTSMEMSWVDWMTEYMPGFKATNKYYQYQNTDLNIKMRYTFQEGKPSFEMESPWFSESWHLDTRNEELVKFDWAMECDWSKGHLDFEQGMDKFTKVKVMDDGTEKTQNKGMHWKQHIDMKMEAEDMKMIFQRDISSQFDKKKPEMYVGTDFSEKWQMNDAKAQMKSSHKVKYDDNDMWASQKTTWNGKMDDGMGTVVENVGEFEVALEEFNMAENSCDAKMVWTGKDKSLDIEYSGSTESSIQNKAACEFVMRYPQKMMSPHDAREVQEADIKEYLMETTDMNEEEIQAEYEYILSNTQYLDNGLFQMADACKMQMRSVYPNELGEEESCEVELEFRNLLDMSLIWNGQELVRFENAMVGEDFQYTFWYMGYEAYTMSPMTWYNKVMEDMSMMASEAFFMYKEHEHYYNEMMSIFMMEDEEAQIAEIMGYIQFFGNWDYAAQKMKEIVQPMFEQAKQDKCGKTVTEHAADYGYYMAPDGEQALLKHYDTQIQFCEYMQMNNISWFSYMKTQACQFATENFGFQMEQDDTMVMEYPEFVVVEHSIAEMNERIEMTCNYYHDMFAAKQNEMCEAIVGQYVECRDNFVMMASAALDSIQDRATAEQMIDNEFAMIEEMRSGQWMEEFMIMWSEM